MISKTIRIAPMIVLAIFALSCAAWAADWTNCSNASLSGTYGFLHDETDGNGAPFTAAVTQLTFDPATARFTGQTTASHDGVIVTQPATGTYSVASNCTGTGVPAGGAPFSLVVTSTGFVALHIFAEGFAISQGFPNCTNAGVQGSFGFEATGAFLADSSSPAVAFIGQLKLTVNPSGEGVIGGHLAASEDGTFVALEPVFGSYTIGADCTGTATILPKGGTEMHFNLTVVNWGKEMLVVETDANTIVSGTMQR